MRLAISEPHDDQPRKRRRLDDNDLETSPSLYNLPPPPLNLHPLSAYNAAFDQSVQHGEYSATVEGERPSSCPRPPSARLDTASGEESFAAVEDVPLSQCCFGMLSRIPVKIKCPSNSSSRNIPVIFQSRNTLMTTAEPNPILFEIPSDEASTILAELESAAEITTQIYCQLEYDPHLIAKSKGKQRGNIPQSWVLNAIIYGPIVLEETVGDFLSKRRMYLQDPLGCDRDVLYRNPHILSPETEDTIMTSSLDSVQGNLEIERLEVGPDLLAQLMEDEDPLHETDAPTGVTTPLFSHQKQALTFLLHRERGWAMDVSERDVWTKQRDTVTDNKFGPNPTFTPKCSLNTLLKSTTTTLQ